MIRRSAWMLKAKVTLPGASVAAAAAAEATVNKTDKKTAADPPQSNGADKMDGAHRTGADVHSTADGGDAHNDSGLDSQSKNSAAADLRDAAEGDSVKEAGDADGAAAPGGPATGDGGREGGSGDDCSVAKSSGADGSADTVAGDDELQVEPQRWEQTEVDHRIIDEKGEYIVSKVKWPTGDLAYRTPPPPNHLQARFGYQIVAVRKHQSWWQHYRRVPRFSWAHIGYQGIFMFGVAWLMTFLHQEVQSYQTDMMSPGNLAGETLGKGRPGKKDMKIEVTDSEQREFLEAMQESYMNATDVAYRGSKNYQMKQIPRPKEFNIRDYIK